MGAAGKMMPGRMGGLMKMGMFGPAQVGDKIDFKNNMEDITKALVEQGIITQEIADKMTAYMEEKAAERKAEMEKVKSMTEEERKAYLESKKESKPEKGAAADPLQKLVDNGTLTQEQADAVSKALFQIKPGFDRQKGAENNTSN